MRDRFPGSMITVSVAAAAVGAVISVSVTRTSAQAPATSAAATAPAPKTAWGEPDLQGIWTDESDTPLQRPAKWADQEFFTEAQRRELDRARSQLGGKDNRAERGTELDVTGSYNDLFISRKHTGLRTSRIVDPPNGRIPLADAAGPEDGRGGAGISPRPDAGHRDLPDQDTRPVTAASTFRCARRGMRSLLPATTPHA